MVAITTKLQFKMFSGQFLCISMRFCWISSEWV